MKQQASKSPSVQPTKTARKIRILLVEPYRMVSQGMAALINQQEGLVICGEAGDPGAALEALPRLKPDLVLMEVTLRSGNGFELIRILSVQHPQLPVLVLSIHEESLYAELALRAGAKGYLMKTEPMETAVGAIRRVLGGQLYLSDAVTAQMLRHQIHGRATAKSSPLELLTDRELQVFQLIGQWHRTKEVAEELHVSVKTVEYHREKIREKLHLKDASELMHFATESATTGLTLGQKPGMGTPQPPAVSAS